MMWKIAVIVLLVITAAYELALSVIRFRSAGNPIPKNVQDVYDEVTYQRWRRYSAEKMRLEGISSAVSFAVLFAMLLTNAHAWAAGLFPQGAFWQLLAVLLVQTVVETVFTVGLSYVDTMVIEEKYGFNRSSMKTFVTDQIKNLLLSILLSAGLMGIFAWLHGWLGDGVILCFTAVVFVITLVIAFLYPKLSRISNKFVPLEEGELREKLTELLTKHGYKVKAIEVMDASRRTTRSNAYFTGYGAMKTIVLYDNLIHTMTTEEICAVFAHELGHGLHKDVPKKQALNILNILLIAVMAWLTVKFPQVYEAFGFTGVNYGFTYILLGSVLLSLTQPLLGLLINAFSRRCEYRADAQAIKEGYGPALVSGLKKLARENFSHLAPSPLLVKLSYSHPPLSQRIAAIEKALEAK